MRLHDATSQKTSISIFVAVRTSNLNLKLLSYHKGICDERSGLLCILSRTWHHFWKSMALCLRSHAQQMHERCRKDTVEITQLTVKKIYTFFVASMGYQDWLVGKYVVLVLVASRLLRCTEHLTSCTRTRTNVSGTNNIITTFLQRWANIQSWMKHVKHSYVPRPTHTLN
jgi:hypothetical protein